MDIGRTKDFNEYIIDGDITRIKLVSPKGEMFETIIDTEDLQHLIELNYPWHLNGYKWSENSLYVNYVSTTVYYKDKNNKTKHKTVYLHEIILGIESSRKIHINHKNHNRLDNRKENLEAVPCAKNAQLRKGANVNSKTGIRNVHWIESANEYWVQIMKHGKIYKWIFSSTQFDEACKFAKEKRKELFGKE